jgi:hypothetical protein
MPLQPHEQLLVGWWVVGGTTIGRGDNRGWGTTTTATACRVDGWVRKQGGDEEGHDAHPMPTSICLQGGSWVGMPKSTPTSTTIANSCKKQMDTMWAQMMIASFGPYVSFFHLFLVFINLLIDFFFFFF